jgi:diacylglycerol O-acyltransferase
VLSNDGHLDVGLIACRELAPQLWDLADDLPIALAELVSAARKEIPKPEKSAATAASARRAGSSRKRTRPAKPA